MWSKKGTPVSDDAWPVPSIASSTKPTEGSGDQRTWNAKSYQRPSASATVQMTGGAGHSSAARAAARTGDRRAAPVVSRGEEQELRLRAAVANVGTHQFEILEPVGGPTWIYTDGRDLGGPLLQLHHVGLAVIGPYEAWEETMARLRADGDEIVQMATVPPGQEPEALFAYVDNRATLGHFTEYLWWAPRLDGLPTFPTLKQGHSA